MLTRSAKRKREEEVVRDEDGSPVRNMVTQGHIPRSRAFYLGGVPYDAHGLADLVVHSEAPWHDDWGVAHLIPPKVPHNPARQLTQNEQAAILTKARETGWDSAAAVEASRAAAQATTAAADFSDEEEDDEEAVLEQWRDPHAFDAWARRFGPGFHPVMALWWFVSRLTSESEFQHPAHASFLTRLAYLTPYGPLWHPPPPSAAHFSYSGRGDRTNGWLQVGYAAWRVEAHMAFEGATSYRSTVHWDLEFWNVADPVDRVSVRLRCREGQWRAVRPPGDWRSSPVWRALAACGVAV